MVKKSPQAGSAAAGNLNGLVQGENVEDEESGIAYQPLQSATHFRLIKLLGRSNHTADVTCVLRNYDIDSEECPTYTAISYTWPKKKAWAKIFLVQETGPDEESASRTSEALLTKQTVSMLQHLRQPNSDRWLWIDAICIDQTSPDERSEQVRLMGRIYSSANVVIAWLAHYEEGWNNFKTSHQAFDFIAEVLFLGTGNFKQYADVKFKTSQQRQTTKEELNSFINGFSSLCNLAYWTRKWILQELTLAHTVVLQAGKRTMPIKDLETMFTTIRQSSKAGLDTLKECARNHKGFEFHLEPKRILSSPAARVITLRSRSNRAFSTLNTLLPLCQLHECAEPRDHLYALYNLIGQHKTNLKIDYGLERLDIYRMSIEFMSMHESMTTKEVVYVISILIRLLGLSNAESLSALQLESTRFFTVTAWVRTRLVLDQETVASQKLRLELLSLQRIPKWLFRDEGGTLKRQNVPAINIAPEGEPVGPQDLVHFGTHTPNLFGLATCRITYGLAVWHVENTKLAFIVAQRSTGATEVVGRAAMYTTSDGKSLSRSWDDIGQDQHSTERVDMELSMSELFVMSCWAEDLINDAS